MEVVNDTPPNIKDLSNFPITKDTIFCYGNKIYNPSGKEIPEDIIFHEKVHGERQGNNPELWWTKYCYDHQFRLQEELIAYAAQYKLITDTFPHKSHKEALTELAINLSTLYNLNLSYGEAESKIRHKAKQL